MMASGSTGLDGWLWNPAIACCWSTSPAGSQGNCWNWFNLLWKLSNLPHQGVAIHLIPMSLTRTSGWDWANTSNASIADGTAVTRFVLKQKQLTRECLPHRQPPTPEHLRVVQIREAMQVWVQPMFLYFSSQQRQPLGRALPNASTLSLNRAAVVRQFAARSLA